MGLPLQAVLLAGGSEDKALWPLAGAAKALLPVGNKPLMSYPLKSLADAGLKHVLVVVSGERAAAAVTSWIASAYASSSLHCEVMAVPEDCGTADALRLAAPKLAASTLVVISGDLLTDFPINALVASHQLNAAQATVLLQKRRVSPIAETKPGKAPKNVDYIGLDSASERLLFYASSHGGTLGDLKLPLAVIRSFGSMQLSSNLVDAHLYVFNRSLLSTLDTQPKLSSLRQDLLPFLSQQLPRLTPSFPSSGSLATAGSAMTGHDSSSLDGGMHGSMGAGTGSGIGLPGAHFLEMSHNTSKGDSGHSRPNHDDGRGHGALRVHIVDAQYCARVSDVQAYGDVCREVADSNVALHLTGLRPSQPHDNVVPSSTSLGHKSTIAAACLLGDGCVVGDKSSIKRSVLGNGCRLGVNVKVLNSVLQDSVSLGDGCHIQNSILCTGVVVGAGAILKDCQIGPGVSVASGSDLKGEVLAVK